MNNHPKPSEVQFVQAASSGAVLALFFMAVSLGYCGTVQEVYSFRPGGGASFLARGADGAFYGTTSQGGDHGYGSVFRATTNGTLSTLVSFALTNGAYPETGLVLGLDGNLYGTTTQGGYEASTTNAIIRGGTVFRVTTNGTLTLVVSTNAGTPSRLVRAADGSFFYVTGYWIMRVTTNGNVFGWHNPDLNFGRCPGLTLGPDGNFYGVASTLGSCGRGGVFRFNPANGSWTTVACLSTTNGFQAMAPLIFGGDGAMYGTTYFGGNFDNGTVFRCTTSGEITNLTSFYFGDYCQSKLLEVGGAFYGTSYENNGKVFKMLPNGSRTTVYTFHGAAGAYPCTELIVGNDGALYGTTGGGGPTNSGTVFRLTMQGNLTTLASFPEGDGSRPESGVTEARDGFFYGTTTLGGRSNYGTFYRVSRDGSFSKLAVFDGVNGKNPHGRPIQGPDGNFYGTTINGLYRASTNGVLTNLANISFDPRGDLVEGGNGYFYGTGSGGGNYGWGSIFRATTNGEVFTFVSFDKTNGANPQAGLIFGNDGALYGTTAQGGVQNAGTVFRVTTNGILTTLISFDAAAGRGNYPRAPLLLGSDGAFYGTTYYTSNGNNGSGTLFSLTAAGAFTNLCYFTGSPLPSYPTGPLVQGSDGAIYGSTITGGQWGSGAIYRVTTNGQLSVLVSFTGFTGDKAGQSPFSGVIQSTDGAFYGTAASGGRSGGGTVFRVHLISKMRPLIKAGLDWDIEFDGIAGNTNRILRATSPSGPWTQIGYSTVGPNGVGSAVDSNSPPDAAFYRTVYP